MTLEHNAFTALIEIQVLYHEMLKELDEIAKQSTEQGEYSALVDKISGYLQDSESGLIAVAEEFREKGEHSALVNKISDYLVLSDG